MIRKIYENILENKKRKKSDEKPIKMTKFSVFSFFPGIESEIPPMFFKFPIEHRKKVFQK